MLNLLVSPESAARNPATPSRGRQGGAFRPRTPDTGLTLVEMLIAMAITLVMMAAVVTVFANVSDSVRNRRATIEMNTQVRHVREALQRDLAAATCPGLPWQRPESNHGYIELIEGPQSDFDPSIWLRDVNGNGKPDGPDGRDADDASDDGLQIDLAVSTLPSSNQGTLPGSTAVVSKAFDETLTAEPVPNAVTDGRGLGDWDDTLAFTARNEDEPFVGRIPAAGVTTGTFATWGSQTIESQLAEIIWFAVENPVEANRTFYFGEPGYRTIYRRALLIAPQLDYRFNIGGQITGPGVVRVLNNGITIDDLDQALASLIAFQERYDLSVRLEWDPQLAAGRWTIVANSLSDLTKRENRFEHYGFVNAATLPTFPFAAASLGAGYAGTSQNLVVVLDPELATTSPAGRNNAVDIDARLANGTVQTFLPATDPSTTVLYPSRPFVHASFAGTSPLTARAILSEDGQVVAVTTGYVPLGGTRRGQDVMLTDALAFDMRVYDPEAPLLAEIANTGNQNFPGSSIEPGDAGWGEIARTGGTGTGTVAYDPVVVGRGAYVDLGYLNLHSVLHTVNTGLTNFNAAGYVTLRDGAVNSSVFALSPSTKSQLQPTVTSGASLEPYRVYDTWSFHYENNGVDEDDRENNGTATITADEGTNGFDDPDPSLGGDVRFLDNAADIAINGPDDPGEYETSPPYNAPLRGVQVTIRAYERDSRQIREVKVRQTFVPQ